MASEEEFFPELPTFNKYFKSGKTVFVQNFYIKTAHVEFSNKKEAPYPQTLTHFKVNRQFAVWCLKAIKGIFFFVPFFFLRQDIPVQYLRSRKINC